MNVFRLDDIDFDLKPRRQAAFSADGKPIGMFPKNQAKTMCVDVDQVYSPPVHSNCDEDDEGGGDDNYDDDDDEYEEDEERDNEGSNSMTSSASESSSLSKSIYDSYARGVTILILQM